MKPKNYKIIKRQAFIFWAWFGILLLCAFAPVYLFVKSHQIQQEYIARDVDDYKQILNKQILLHEKVDSLYKLTDLLNKDAVTNEQLLEILISSKRNETISIIGADSGSFPQYSFLLSHIDSIITLKDTIREMTYRKSVAFKDFNDCKSNTKKVQLDISDDPSRHFSASH
ncbi:type VI secretion system TssO [Taibaiella soli]|uniref:Uncharacterized protein n=1 Tax=Taibaiella soli TaxID=1649169 RepID=A0A2W2AYG6_9BACT|nr:type VI secretion system TssO [Taibaiella soli]PZF72738.1 hypothetical protein DN068_12830 [Taibaiella soli]